MVSELVALRNLLEDMDQDSSHIVAASKEVIENGATLPKTQLVEGVMTVMPIKSAKDKAQRRLKVKAGSTLMMGIPNEHQLKFNSIKDAKLLLEAIEKRFEILDQTFDRIQKLVSQLELLGEKLSQEDVNQKLLRSLSPEWNTHAVMWRNKADLDTMSIDDFYNNLKVYEPEVKGISSSSSSTQKMAFVSSSNNNTSSSNEAVNAAHEVTTTSTQVNTTYSINIDNLSDVVICLFFASQPNRRKLTANGNETIGFDKSKVECYKCHNRGHFARECRAPRNQDNKKESSRKSVHVETSTSTAFVSCDGLGGYDWSDQAEEGPNYALMAYSSSSSDSEDIQVGEITIRELRKKLEKIQKEKDSIQFNVDKFENASKSLDKLIECQIVDNCKKGLGYEKYNAVPPPYIGNFMPPTPDLSFTGLDEFVNEPVVENSKAMSSEEEPKVVRKNDDALIIEEWVSDSEEENVSQTKTEKKIVKPSIAKIEFVKPKQQEKTARKTVKQLIDESQVLLRVPRKNNMYSVDLKNIVPKGGLTCLFEKATSDESKLWHRRLGHLNFKTMNKLVKGNLVRGLPSKFFENDQPVLLVKRESSTEPLVNMDGSGPDWLFDIDALTKSMNYKPIVAGTQSNGFACTKASDNAGQARKETKPVKNYILLPLYTVDPPFSQDPKSLIEDGSKPSSDKMERRLMKNSIKEINDVGGKKQALNFYLIPNILLCWKIIESEDEWCRATQYKTDVKKLEEHRKNPKRLVAQGYTQEEGIDYDKVFAPVARIEAIRLFLAYASFKDFVVYQMDVKSAFLYGKIKKRGNGMINHEDLKIRLSDRVYRLKKQLKDYISSSLKLNLGLQKSEMASTPMETQKPLLKDENGEEVDVHMYRSMIGSLMYLTSSRPDIMFAVCACARYQVNPKIVIMLEAAG
ncbi:ribonuclease H-like domain-containing protein [Tanacetum coccineum]|uniref:Ribonuclease H-like domain-containing protein n=1 Tax=Tanacetum coccineum TaxID=301880 RepID=A0ABQ5E032_9ASTR